MKKTYLKIFELLAEIDEIRYIDLDAGQLKLEKPPVAYPFVLVKIDENTVQDVEHTFQIIQANISLTVGDKYLSETNNLTTAEIREKGLKYLELCEKIYQKLQGYAGDGFESFTFRSGSDSQIRNGIKTVVQRWETSYQKEN